MEQLLNKIIYSCAKLGALVEQLIFMVKWKPVIRDNYRIDFSAICKINIGLINRYEEVVRLI